jgi:hypothetical protein
VRLHIFDSDHGDCLLLVSRDGKYVLCDGGMSSSMKSHVRGELAKLRTAGHELDYVYISHIDSDHISGVLQLLNDEVEWRVHDFQMTSDSPPDRPPRVPRPPVINGLLHNAFKDQIGINQTTDVADLLAAAVPSLYATADPDLVDVGLRLQDLAASIPEALKVSRLSAGDALDIPVNRLPGTTEPGKLLFFRDEIQSFKVGSMKFTIVGPTEQELTDLKRGWITWLQNTQDEVRRIRRELRRRIDEFSNGVSTDSPFDLRGWNGIPDYKGVTAPNVASLMFMVEEGSGAQKKRLLLTGDSQQDKILRGLRQTNFLAGQGLHVDVLKVQHHGSENNLDADFARQVSARHYVFCGNGQSGNPNPDVIDLIFESRLGPASARTLAAAADGQPFHFWFSTSSSVDDDAERRFGPVERHVEQLRHASQGQLITHFNQGVSIELAI